MALHIAQIVEVDQFEPIIEDFDNFFLKEICKAEIEALNLRENFIYDIILLS